MRLLKWLVGILLVLAVGLWFAAKVLVEKATAAWFEDQAKRGMQAETGTIGVGGFPARLDLGLTDVKLVNPATGGGWEGPWVNIWVPSWKPWQVSLRLPETQTLRLPGQSVGITSQGLEGMARVSPDRQMALQEVVIGSAALTAVSSLGWTVGADDLRLRLLVDDKDPSLYALTLDAIGIAPDPSLATAMAALQLPGLPAPDLPPKAEAAALVLGLHLSPPIAMNGSGADPQLTGLDVTTLSLTWGPLRLGANGRLAADATGHAEGRIDITVEGWDRLPALLAATGAIKPEVAPTIGGFLKAMAEADSDPAVLNVPLLMQDGRASLGPFPLGAAPVFGGPKG